MSLKCKSCGTTVMEDAKFCPNCGVSLSSQPILCKKCDAGNPPNARYCKKCGSALSRKRSKKGESTQKVTNKSFTKNPYFIIMLIGIIAIVIATAYNYQLLRVEKEKIDNQPLQQNTQQPPQSAANLDLELLKRHIEVVSEQLKNDPDNAELNTQMGNLLFDSQRYSEAIPYYTKAIALDPNKPDVIVDLGVSYYYLKNNSKARELFERALKINPDHIQALFNLGVVAWQMKETNVLMESWGKLVKIAPNSPQAQQAAKILDQIHKNVQQSQTNMEE